MNKKTKKYSLLFSATLFLLAMFFLFTTQRIVHGEAQCEISATKGATVNINDIAECLEDRYAYDKDMVRRLKKKDSPPSVNVYFNTTDPKEGEEVTAIAAPNFFRTDPSDLYYTWYVIHFDEDGNPTNTLEEGIREAMGIVARGKFDPCLWGVDPDCDGIYNVPDTDNDGVFLPYGGRTGVGSKEGDSIGLYDDDPDVYYDEPKQIVRADAITRCYEKNFGKKQDAGYDYDAGRDRIIECEHHFANCGGITGDGIFNLAEEECWKLNPQNSDTDGDGIPDEADVAGLSQSEFTWTYRERDQVGVIVEGTSFVPIVEGGELYETEVVGWQADVGGNIMIFDTYQDAYAACEGFLVDTVDMGNASADSGTTTEGTEGEEGSSTSSSSVSVDLEADLDAYNQGMSLYIACVESISQITERSLEEQDGRLNSYYKIMWAMPDFDEEGFYYPATLPVEEKDREILDPEIDFLPKNPQFEQANPRESDFIIASAAIANPDTDPAFLFYEWEVRLCTENDPFECPEIVTNLMEFESFTSGIGVKKVKFRPRDETIFSGASSTSKAWLKLSVVVSEHESYVGGATLDHDQDYFPIGAVDYAMIPVLRNEMNIRIFRAVNNGGTWTRGEEICADGLYRDICPLYPNEVLAAEVVAPSGAGLFAWQVNSLPIPRPIDCVFSDGCNSYGSVVFFTVDGAEKSTGTIGVTANRSSGSNLISQRIFSVYNPFAVISASGGATPLVKHDGTEAQDLFEAPPNTSVSFVIDELVPNYVGFDEVDIEWYINGEQVFDGTIVRPEFLEYHQYMDASVSGDGRTITFNVGEKYGTGHEVKARIVRIVPEDEQDALYSAWRILDTYTLTQDRAISVKVAFDGAAGETDSLKQFFASSLRNAPEYLVFVIRLAIALVLIWSVFFGLTYAVKLDHK